MRGDFHDRANGTEFNVHPIFGLRYPKQCKDVSSAILDPMQSWQDASAYAQSATQLREMFRENFTSKGYEGFGIEPVM